MKSLAIVCPAYNEEENVGNFYLELKEVLSSLSGFYESEIIFVIDGAIDGTLDILRRFSERDATLKIISFSTNFGHQAALLAGIDYCNADAIIMMDSDMQHPPSLIPKLLQEFEKGHDVVYTIREDTRDTSLFKRTSSRLFYRMLNYVSKVQINESAADFRLISRRVAKVFQAQIRERNLFLRGLFAWVGFRSTGITYTVRKRGGGKSKYSLLKMLRFGMN